MRIIIVGAGAVGTHLAERLSLEGQDVVVIENDPQRAAELKEELDALIITGNGASASVLTEAGVAHSDLLIAASSNDGANFIACHTAKRLGVGRTVARVQDPGLRDGSKASMSTYLLIPLSPPPAKSWRCWVRRACRS